MYWPHRAHRCFPPSAASSTAINRCAWSTWPPEPWWRATTRTGPGTNWARSHRGSGSRGPPRTPPGVRSRWGHRSSPFPTASRFPPSHRRPRMSLPVRSASPPSLGRPPGSAWTNWYAPSPIPGSLPAYNSTSTARPAPRTPTSANSLWSSVPLSPSTAGSRTCRRYWPTTTCWPPPPTSKASAVAWWTRLEPVSPPSFPAPAPVRRWSWTA